MKKVNVFDAIAATGQARKMLAAGEFMAAVATIYKQNGKALEKGETPPVNEEAMDGLIYGLELIGHELANEGFSYLHPEADDSGEV